MRYFIVLYFFIMNCIAYSYINIIPTSFEKNITKGATEDFYLSNRTDMVKKYRIYTEDIPDKKSMTDWVEVYPKSIQLKPWEQKLVKVYVEAPKNAPTGDYYSTIVFKEVDIPKIRNTNKDTGKPYKIMTMLKLRIKGEVKR